MNWLLYIIVGLLSYLLGCSNMALYLSKAKGIDLRKGGSGNLGASNALVLMGWKAGVLVGIHDIGKAVIAVLLVKHLCPELDNIGAVAGVAVVLGHMFPFYLKFKGGKGFASYLGMTIALNFRFALIVLVAVVLITLITDYIALATFTTVISVPVYFGIAEHSMIAASILFIATAAIIYKHRENIVRMANGTEIGFRRANRGDDRKQNK